MTIENTAATCSIIQHTCQGCGSAFIFCGSGSSCFSQYPDPDPAVFLSVFPDPAVFLSVFPDPAVFLIVYPDPDPAAFSMRIRFQLKQNCKKLPYEEISVVEKNKNSTKTMELVHIYTYFLAFFNFFP